MVGCPKTDDVYRTVVLGLIGWAQAAMSLSLQPAQEGLIDGPRPVGSTQEDDSRRCRQRAPLIQEFVPHLDRVFLDIVRPGPQDTVNPIAEISRWCMLLHYP